MSNTILLRHSGKRIWLVDASIYVFRAWFVKNHIPYDKKHHPINAVSGFLRFIYQLLQEQQPEYLAFAFDTSQQTSVRKTIFPDYKANRPPAPEELKYQFQLCREFLDAMGLVQQSSEHHEADDLIGSWAAQQRRANRDNPLQIVILSGDKDLAQLVMHNDLWWDYGRRKPLHDGGIKSHFGVWPRQLADQLAIAGDKADNRPGIPGVGMATAAKLLRRFGDLDNMLNNIELIGKMQVQGAKRLQQLVQEHQHTLAISRKLTEIDCTITDLPDQLHRGPKQPEKLGALCELLNLSTEQYEMWLAI